MRERRIGDGPDIVEVENRDRRPGRRAGIRREREDPGQIGEKERAAIRGSMDFDLGVAGALESLDEDEIDRRKAAEELAQTGLGLVPEFVD
jgi:hypothetical protein